MRDLKIGDIIDLFGGYDNDDWLGGYGPYHGRIERFVEWNCDAPLAIVRLDRSATAEDVSGEYLVLGLRHQGARWAVVGIAFGFLLYLLSRRACWLRSDRGIITATYEVSCVS